MFSENERRDLRERLVAAARDDARIAAAAVVGPSFRLLFGEANAPTSPPRPAPETLIGMGWLYALHARSSIARGRSLQALHMVNQLRDQVVSLACLRHGLPAAEGRGADDLPPDILATIAETLVRGLHRRDLSTAFANAMTALINEAEQIDSDLASRLRVPAQHLTRAASKPDATAREDARQ